MTGRWRWLAAAALALAALWAASAWWAGPDESAAAEGPLAVWPPPNAVAPRPAAPPPPEAQAPPAVPALEAGAPDSAAVVSPGPSPRPPPPRPSLDDAPAQLRAPLEALAPVVAQCADDQAARWRGPLALTVHFVPLRDGGFGPKARAESSWPDPYLTACVEDAFEEVGFTPSGAEREERASYTFRFER